jgi:enamine deaminase RidA (YjgF/YER057c/UK114 family)
LARNLTQNGLARRCNLEPSYISALEANKKEPGAGTIMALCRALEVSPNVLLLGSDDGTFPSLRESRLRAFSGSPWEQEVGYCRAIRVGDRIEVAGTTSVVDGVIMHPDDPYRQTVVIVSIIKKALEDLGGQMADIVRLRLFVTDADYIAEAARAFRENGLPEILPVMTAVVVKALVDPHLDIEIEADAVTR